jgi:3'(2'), 5'-bisphosphate nucleotidase
MKGRPSSKYDRKHSAGIAVVLVFSVAVLALSVALTFSSRLSLFKQQLRKASVTHRSSAGLPKIFIPKMAYERELEVALLAVQRATILTKRVFHEKAKGIQSKEDRSPVTIGDLGAQALIISAIHKNFPSDEIVGEEDADMLHGNQTIRAQVWNYVQSTKLSDAQSEALLGGSIPSEEEMLDAISRGRSSGGPKGRIWALDPIDGTKGFLRGGQYAVCLALMVDGDVKVGVLGCPNLPIDDTTPLDVHIGENATDEGRGVMFSAVQGHGAFSGPLGDGAVQSRSKIHMKPLENVKDATFCESFEAGHSSHGDQAEIAKKLGITKPGVRMDSQAKYGSIARGAGDLYLRLPTSNTYQEKIWDHAAGNVIVKEAGGVVTDITGKQLDFSIGRTLRDNKGIVAAPVNIHPEVIDAVKSVLGL